jgi:hypothetical protein
MTSSKIRATGTGMQAGTAAVAGGTLHSTIPVLAEVTLSVTILSSVLVTARVRTLTAIWLILTA